jgi:hypothetical protein
MRVLLRDVVLFSCLLAFVTGIVIAVGEPAQLDWQLRLWLKSLFDALNLLYNEEPIGATGRQWPNPSKSGP